MKFLLIAPEHGRLFPNIINVTSMQFSLPSCLISLPITGMAFSPDSKRIVSVSLDKTSKIVSVIHESNFWVHFFLAIFFILLAVGFAVCIYFFDDHYKLGVVDYFVHKSKSFISRNEL